MLHRAPLLKQLISLLKVFDISILVCFFYANNKIQSTQQVYPYQNIIHMSKSILLLDISLEAILPDTLWQFKVKIILLYRKWAASCFK